MGVYILPVGLLDDRQGSELTLVGVVCATLSWSGLLGLSEEGGVSSPSTSGWGGTSSIIGFDETFFNRFIPENNFLFLVLGVVGVRGSAPPSPSSLVPELILRSLLVGEATLLLGVVAESCCVTTTCWVGVVPNSTELSAMVVGVVD